MRGTSFFLSYPQPSARCKTVQFLQEIPSTIPLCLPIDTTARAKSPVRKPRRDLVRGRAIIKGPLVNVLSLGFSPILEAGWFRSTCSECIRERWFVLSGTI